MASQARIFFLGQKDSLSQLVVKRKKYQKQVSRVVSQASIFFLGHQGYLTQWVLERKRKGLQFQNQNFWLRPHLVDRKGLQFQMEVF